MCAMAPAEATDRSALRTAVIDLMTGARRDRDAVLSAIWAWQTARCAPVAAHARAYGLPVGRPVEVDAIEALPTSAFRHGDLVTWPLEAAPAAAEFRSSGTTSRGERPSRHLLRQLDLYEASIVAGFDAAVTELRQLTAPLRVISLLPDGRAWPHSSLVHMFDTLMRVFDEGGGVHAARPDGLPDPAAVTAALDSARAERAVVLLLGTSSSHLALFDESDGVALDLPTGSLVVDTGGAKGRAEGTQPGEVAARASRRYGIPPARVIAEYGMAELGSQAYGRHRSWATVTGASPTLRFPPWVRVQVMDPDRGTPVAEGQCGIVQVFDPVNLDSCAFIQTQDIARVEPDGGFTLVGRARFARARGCSLSVPWEANTDGAAEAAARPAAGIPFEARPDPATDRIAPLAAAWAGLADTTAPGIQTACAAVAAATGLSPQQVGAALLREGRRWTREHLWTLVARELAPLEAGRGRAVPVDEALIIPAATVPFAGLESVTAALLAGARVTVRPSGRNPVELGLFAAALERHAPALARRITQLDPDDGTGLAAALARADTVVVHGSAATVRSVRSSANACARVIAYGPRWSVGAGAPEDFTDEATLRALAWDMLLHDSLGCMTPRAILVAGDQDDARLVADRLAARLALASPRLAPHDDVGARPLGAGPAERGIDDLLRSARGLESVRRAGSARILLADEATDDTPGLAGEPPIMRRTALICAVSPDAPPTRWLPPQGDPLSTVGLGRHFARSPLGQRFEAAAVARGAVRMTDLQRMQTPPPAWPHDGQPLLLPYLRVIAR